MLGRCVYLGLLGSKVKVIIAFSLLVSLLFLPLIECYYCFFLETTEAFFSRRLSLQRVNDSGKFFLVRPQSPILNGRFRLVVRMHAS